MSETTFTPVVEYDETGLACRLVFVPVDPARLAAMAVISAAGLNVAGADLGAAAEQMRRELDVAEAHGRVEGAALAATASREEDR